MDENMRQNLSQELGVSFHEARDGSLTMTGPSGEHIRKAKKQLKKLFKYTTVIRLGKNLPVISKQKELLKNISDETDCRLIFDRKNELILLLGAEEGVQAVIERIQMMYEMIEHYPVSIKRKEQ